MPRRRSNHFQIASDDEKSYLAVADFFLSFANPALLMILSAVRKKEMTAEEISRELGTRLNTALVKLNAMERKGILASRVRSQKTLYRVADLKFLKAFDRILEFPVRKLKQAGTPKEEFRAGRGKNNKSLKADIRGIRSLETN